MKTQSFGLGRQTYTPIFLRGTRSPFSREFEQKECVRDYIKSRFNGDFSELPCNSNGTFDIDKMVKQKGFPYDGTYSLDAPDAPVTRIRYTEGPRDKAWMEEQDIRYLAKLVKDGSLREKEPEMFENISSEPQKWEQLFSEQEKKVAVREKKRNIATLHTCTVL